MIFARETVGDVRDEMLPLIQIHYREIASFQDIELCPDFQLYEAAEKMDAIRIYTVRSETEGELVGYAIFFIRHHPHYKNSLQATQDLLFIHPDHRGPGMKFVSYCDEQLKNDHVDVVYHLVTTRFDFSPILKRLGYEKNETIYAKRLS